MKTRKTLILDNYDSFTFNLCQLIASLDGNPVVYKNDEITLEDIEKIKPTHIVISPGPGTPEKESDFHVCGKVIKKFGAKIPLLGVCLGHQGIILEFGGKITRAPEIVHGKTSTIILDTKCPIFKGLPKKIEAMRYHSLMGDRKTLPKDLKIIAETENGLLMGVQHEKFPIFGIQFHPESFKTKEGSQILKNFLK